MSFKDTYLFLLLFYCYQSSGYCQIQEKNIKEKSSADTHHSHSHILSDSPEHRNINQHCKLEIPAILPTDTIIVHTGFSLLYNEKYEQARWVAYELTKEETDKKVKRSNKFIPDPKVSTHTANNEDYKGSGYDRGHLAPAGDMSWSQTSMDESFCFSNISPQIPAFNRGIWKKLEELVRSWAVENAAVYVVTGPIINNNPTTIGANRVAVPDYYFKVILDYSLPDIKGIGFVLPNASYEGPLEHFAMSIDDVEKITGIDLFPLIPDEQENAIENTLCVYCWEWGLNKSK